MNNEEVEFRPDGFHLALDAELSALTAPPLGGVVGLATQRGRRQRRWRIAGAAVGSVTAVAATVALLAGTLGTGSPAPAAVGPAAVLTTPSNPASPSASPSPSATVDPLVPSTASALLDAVVRSMPAGLTTDHHAANQADGTEGPAVFAYVNTPSGTGRISVGAYRDEVDMGPCRTGTWGSGTTTCSTSPAGDVVEVQTNSTNCIQATRVTVHRPGGLNVGIDISSCLNSDGTKNPPAVPALTQEQAVALASSPLIDLRMPASFVEAANAKYPALPSP